LTFGLVRQDGVIGVTANFARLQRIERTASHKVNHAGGAQQTVGRRSDEECARKIKRYSSVTVETECAKVADRRQRPQRTTTGRRDFPADAVRSKLYYEPTGRS
jgi:hypothetical protein